MVQSTMSPAAKLYLKDIMQTKPISKKEEQELFKLYRQGNLVARKKLLISNMRFVLKVAKQYHVYTIPISDLVSEGAIGLARAIESFDHTRGWKFISYAVWWIKVYITRCINEHGTLIRLPANKKLKVQKALKEQAGDEALSDEIQELIRLGERGISFDTHVSSDSDISFSEVIADDKSVQPDVITEIGAGKKFARELLNDLSKREAEVLKRFYGVDYESTETLKSISESLGISKERVRQIRDKALRQLKKGPHKSTLKERLMSCVEAHSK
ncbi:MAG: RNA polymerase sigma factor RpoD/SigA [Fibrobacteria bacterium]|nr:RNA polymerase sigma factor RpoD/SigA [Fibrobacteria bacterium]